MIKRIFFFSLFSLSLQCAIGQEQFYSGIRVEFEKTTSVRQLMKDLQGSNPWYEQNKERYPVSLLNYYEFTGDTSRSLYKPGKDVPIDMKYWYRPVGDKNV